MTLFLITFKLKDAAKQRLAHETVVRIEEVISLLDLGSFVIVRCEKTAEEPFYVGQVRHYFKICDISLL